MSTHIIHSLFINYYRYYINTENKKKEIFFKHYPKYSSKTGPNIKIKRKGINKNTDTTLILIGI